MKRRTLLAIVALAFGLSAFGFFSYEIKSGMKRAAFYEEQDRRLATGEGVFTGPYCFPDRHPKLLLKIAFLIGISALVIGFGKGNIFPATLLLATTSIHGGWYRYTQESLAMAESYIPQGLDSFFYNASIHDLAAIGLTAFAAMAFSAKVIGGILNKDVLPSRILRPR